MSNNVKKDEKTGNFVDAAIQSTVIVADKFAEYVPNDFAEKAIKL